MDLLRVVLPLTDCTASSEVEVDGSAVLSETSDLRFFFGDLCDTFVDVDAAVMSEFSHIPRLFVLCRLLTVTSSELAVTVRG